MPEPQPPSPAEIVEALRRDLDKLLERLPDSAESSLSFKPLSTGDGQ